MLQKIAEPHSKVPYPRVFWQSAFASSYRLGWGKAAWARSLPSFLNSSSCWFGCQGFDAGGGWFFQPQELIDEPTHHFSLKHSSPLPSILERVDGPSFEEWKNNVAVALEQIQKRTLKKVVLARVTTLSLSGAISPWDILSKLQEQHHPSTTLFLVQRSPATAFIGATPEKLYERKGLELKTMALAGTRKKSLDLEDDILIRHELMTSAKELQEVAIVQDELRHALDMLCHQIICEQHPSLLETNHLYHLLYSLQGKLHPDIGDSHLLQLLHPTPALGGSPRAPALRLIKTLEPFRRGWYGAPLGWFSTSEADVAVGIRSALIQNQRVHLYAGAGIVNGSDAKKEWEELDNKITGFLKLWENRCA